MAWLAHLDTVASRWSRPAHWSYLTIKWGLVLVGAIALAGVWADRLGIWSLY